MPGVPDDFHSAVDACRSIQRLPGGRRIPIELAHTLLVLATYWPNIYPGHERLAGDLKIKRRQVSNRLKALEDAGLVTRQRRTGASTRYWLKLRTIRELA